jgi:hypothetical protein
MKDASPDHDDRIKDFFARHGGPGQPVREGENAAGQQGWSEVYAKDGYVLRCEWSRVGSREEMSYTERAP